MTNNLKIMRREVVLDLQLREPGLAVNVYSRYCGISSKAGTYLVDQPHARDGKMFLFASWVLEAAI